MPIWAVLTPANAALIAAAYGLGRRAQLTGPVARGELGQLWRLQTDRGVVAVKEPFAPPDVADVEADARFQDDAHAAGVPMPAVVRTRDGAVGATIRDTFVRVYEWVDLLAPDRTLQPAVVGELVARIHRVTHAGSSGLDPWFSAPVGAGAWDALVADLRAAHAPFAERYATIRDELVALEAWLTPPSQLQTCHRDLFADNLLATRDGGACVIDWENSGLADPSQELAVVLFEFAARDAARARELHDAYREAGGPGRVARRGDFSMAIAVFGHLTEHYARRWLDPAEAHQRDRSAWRVDECLDDFLDRAAIDQLLDAVT